MRWPVRAARRVAGPCGRGPPARVVLTTLTSSVVAAYQPCWYQRRGEVRPARPTSQGGADDADEPCGRGLPAVLVLRSRTERPTNAIGGQRQQTPLTRTPRAWLCLRRDARPRGDSRSTNVRGMSLQPDGGGRRRGSTAKDHPTTATGSRPGQGRVSSVPRSTCGRSPPSWPEVRSQSGAAAGAYSAARSMTRRSGLVSVKTRMQAGPVSPATHSLWASKSPACTNSTSNG